MRDVERSVRRLLLLLPLLVAGCTTTEVQIEPTFPKQAAVDPLPIALGVTFDEAFSTYVLEEPVPQRGDWRIDIGVAQVEMLRTLLPSMFERVVEVENAASAPTDLDGVLIPAVEDMQFAIPFQTKSNFFEVWIRYRMELREPGTGELVATWPLTAYGRTRDAFLDSAQEAINQAAITALRDAAAFLAIDFLETRELQGWLQAVLRDDPEGIPPPSLEPSLEAAVEGS
jgi:hypothetical protein